MPIKALGSRFKPERLYANRSSFAQSERQAAALAASAIANRVLIEPGANIPRRLKVDGVEMAIENGAGRDILSSGMASLADATVGQEVFALSPSGCAAIIRMLGRDTLENAGVLDPLGF